MKLIVGLGNPGSEYNNTRHNVGFMVMDFIAEQLDLKYEKSKFGGLYIQGTFNGKKYILLKPQKYMNLSGKVIYDFVNYFKISLENILIIHDDLDLSIGRFKFKANGSSAGHNGLKDIEYYLKTRQYKRLKIGISNDKNMNTKNYVLGKFLVEERQKIDKIIQMTPSIFCDFLNIDFNKIMNKYNHK